MAKSTVTGTTHELPFDKLSPRDFERLCLWLVEREGYERAEHLGAAGSEQGRDIIAWREGALWAFQCKNVKDFYPKKALAEVEKVLTLPEDQRPAGLVFLVACDVSVNTRQQVRERCAGQIQCHFWTGTELDQRVKRHPDILAEFFHHLDWDDNLRDQELAYLNTLLTRYEHWLDHYTPLAGIAEVRAAVKDGPRLDLPMPFIPPGFEKLTEHGFGERAKIRRESVNDLRAAVAEHRRIVLLGDPGSGKTTTLWRLAYDYANAAKTDAQAPLPLLVPLGAYTGDDPFDAYLARHMGPLAPHLDIYRASGRLILLLDGLNEMPQASYAERVNHIRTVLDRYPDGAVVVTCRALDYVEKLEQLQKVEVSPLNKTRIRDFLHNYLGETAGEHLFRAMGGDVRRTPGKEPPPLLALGRNPYLLLMTAQVYAVAGGELPANRARLFAAFVDTLLDREKKRHPQEWITAERQKDGLAALAYTMQDKRVTTVECEWAVTHLRQTVPDCNAERLLYLATSATLLDADDSTVRFYHQLLQEYFAASHLLEMGDGLQILHSWGREVWAREIIVLFLWLAEPVVAAEEACRFMEDVDIDLRIRIAAGEVAGERGDPRLGRRVKVPGGEFTMGDIKYNRGKPLHKVYVPDFCIDKYPVTNAQYKEFVEDAAHRCPNHWENNNYPHGKANHPVTWVNWYDANSYCEWMGRKLGRECRLPTEAEWEKAARGNEGDHIYPWGNDYRAVCNTKESKVGGTTPVGLYPQGTSPYGVLDISGNVWEWCTTLYRPYPYNAGDGRENVHIEGERVLRGGAWNLDKELARCFIRNKSMPEKRYANRGFRCVYPLVKA